MKVTAFTVFLDLLGLVGLLAGCWVIIRSKYITENTKDAAILIDTQRKRIDDLEKTVGQLTVDRDTLAKESHRQAGELDAYRRLSYIEPEVITKLTHTMDSILELLKENKTGGRNAKKR